MSREGRTCRWKNKVHWAKNAVLGSWKFRCSERGYIFCSDGLLLPYLSFKWKANETHLSFLFSKCSLVEEESGMFALKFYLPIMSELPFKPAGLLDRYFQIPHASLFTDTFSMYLVFQTNLMDRWWGELGRLEGILQLRKEWFWKKGQSQGEYQKWYKVREVFSHRKLDDKNNLQRKIPCFVT